MAQSKLILPGRITKKHLPLLCKVLQELNAEWERFGIALHVPYDTIQAIKDNPEGLNAEKKMIRVLDKLKQQGNITWRNIYDAVIALDDIALAESIKQLHPDLDSKVPAGDDDYIDTMIALLKGVIPRWEAFGLYLDIDYDELQVVNAGKLTAAECMMKLLVKWIELKGEKATICEIIQACIRINNFDLAERLQNNDDIKKKLNMEGVCKVFYEEACDIWKAHVVIAKADKEKELIAKYKGFYEGPKMIVGFSEDELSLHYSTDCISGWRIDHNQSKIHKSQIDSGHLCAFTINLACEVCEYSPLTLPVEITGVKPPNTFTIERNSFVYNSRVTIPSKRSYPHD